MNTLQRISVVGTSGCGKTTLARNISKRLQIPHIELDALYWQPNWTETPDPIFQERTKDAIKDDQWVIDGNYSRIRNLVWQRADTVIWLDYSFFTILFQLLHRTFRRVWTQEELWQGNRERFLTQLTPTDDSIIWWMMKTYHRRRKQYSQLFQQPEYNHLKIIKFKSPRETKRWLEQLKSN